ncbi:MAG: transposase [Romboutsia sp.]
MAKYDFDFKMKVVKSYLDGEGGLGSIAKQYGIGSETQVKTRVKKKKTENLLYYTV